MISVVNEDHYCPKRFLRTEYGDLFGHYIYIYDMYIYIYIFGIVHGVYKLRDVAGLLIVPPIVPQSVGNS